MTYLSYKDLCARSGRSGRYIEHVVVAVGIDIVEIARIAKACRQPRFIARILTPAEQAICKTPLQVAGRWAAKEAAKKCLPTKVNFRQIEILRAPNGAPQLTLHDVEGSELLVAHVSITHEKTMAAAVVILERRL